MSGSWFVFEGRMDRKTYFFRFAIISLAFFAGLAIAKYLTVIHRDYGETLYPIVCFLGAGAFCCTNAQRLHDINKSGWWQLTLSVPYAGFILLILFLLLKKGTRGTNRFGPDPLAP